MLKTCVLPAFGTTLLARVEQPAVATWVAGMRARGLSASRIRQAYRVMSSLMAAAVQGGYLARTPCTGIRLPRAARRDATLLTAAEVDRLAEAAGEYGTLIYLLAYGGLRWGEVAALRLRRCDLLRRRVEVGGCLGRQRAAALQADQDVRAAVGAAATSSSSGSPATSRGWA